MTAAFNLFRLPYIAYANVLDFITPDQIFKLSFTSKRTHQTLLSTHGKWKKQSGLQIILKDSVPAIIRYNNHILCQISRRNVGSEAVDFSKMIFFCKEVQPIYDYCSELFNAKIEDLGVIGEVGAGAIQRFTSGIPILNSCFINLESKYPTDFPKLPKILDVLKIHSENSKFSGTFNVGTLEILHGFLLSFEMLLEAKCALMAIHETQFTSFDVNFLVKKWKMGESCKRLKWICLGIDELELEEVLDGIDYEDVDRSEERSFRICSEKSLQIRGGFDIKRNDGTVATIFLRQVSEPLPPFFEMVVWPDWSDDNTFFG